MKQWLIACLVVTVLPAWAAGDAQRGAESGQLHGLSWRSGKSGGAALS